MLASVSHLHALLEEIHAAGVIVHKTMATKGIQVDLDPGDLMANKRFAFFSLVFRPVPPPIVATLHPRRARDPEVAIARHWSGHIEEHKQKGRMCLMDTTHLQPRSG
jgi:hypothetical protein